MDDVAAMVMSEAGDALKNISVRAGDVIEFLVYDDSNPWGTQVLGEFTVAYHWDDSNNDDTDGRTDNGSEYIEDENEYPKDYV